MIKKMILSFGLLFIVGCGAQSNPNEEGSSTVSDSVSNLISPEDNQSVTTSGSVVPEALPQEESSEAEDATAQEQEEVSSDEDPSLLPPKVSLAFPTLLKSQEEEVDINESNQSTEEDLGYLQLKKSIEKIDGVIDLVQVNLNILDKVMPEVQQRCEGMIACVFQKDTLSFVMDNETMAAINTVIVDKNRTLYECNESTIALGEVGFYTYDLNESYQYMITLDILNSKLYHQDKNVIKEFQTIKWSEDNQDVLTLYDYEDNETNSSIVLHYLIDDSNKETMHVYNQDDSQKVGYQETTSLVLSKTEDENSSEGNTSTYSLTSNSILKEEENTSRFSANIEINSEESHLLFSGSVSDENSSTEVAVSSELSCDNNQSCDENSSDELRNTEVELYELRIVGGNLEDGDYVLLAPDTDIESLSLRYIFENSLGNFTVSEGERQGALHSDGFLYLLNSLIIVHINPSQESTNMFEIVSLEDKPTLRIVK